jgi:hypothetical protein
LKALFADLSERARPWNNDMAASKVRERQHVLALCDAVQMAIAEGQHDRVAILLKEVRAIVDSALARRRETPLPISA